MVTASVPGVPPSDIDITILATRCASAASARRRLEETGQRGTGGCCESVALGPSNGPSRCPSVVNSEGSSADFKDGVLTITLPKADVAKPRSIPIRGAASATRRPEEGQSTEVEIHDVRLSIGSGQTLGTATPHRAARDKTQVRSRKPSQRRRCECPAASPPGPLSRLVIATPCGHVH